MTEKQTKLEKSLNIRVSDLMYQTIRKISAQSKRTNSEVVRKILENEMNSYISIFEEIKRC